MFGIFGHPDAAAITALELSSERVAREEGSAVAEVDLLGHTERIAWEQTTEGLVVTLPVGGSTSLPLALRIGLTATS